MNIPPGHGLQPGDQEWQWLDDGRLLVAASFLPVAKELGWDSAAGACASTGGEDVRSTPGRRTSVIRNGGQVYFRKVHHRGWGVVGWRDRVRMKLGRTVGPARTEFFWNRRLAALGIGVPVPVLLAEQGGRNGPSALVTIGVPGSCSLMAVSPDRARQVLAQAVEMTACLHQHGVVHRDLYLDHFLLGSDGKLRLADLQRLIRPVCCFERWRVKDLAALYYSRPDWVSDFLCRRFLVHYCRCLNLPDSRRLAARVFKKTARIAAHEPRWG